MTRRLIDLSTPIRTDHFRWPVSRKELKSHGADSYLQATWIGWPIHGFTHMDAPRHFDANGKTTSQLPLDVAWGPAVVVDLSAIGPDEPVTPAMLEAANADIRPGDIILLKTAWDTKASIDEATFWSTAPYMTTEACRWLYARSPKGVAYDFPQDHCIRDMVSGEREPAFEENVTHIELLLKGVTMFEYLCNLSEIRRERVEFFGLPLKVPDSDGAPIRAVAVEDE
ncbi:cyclase family protein [Acuticoccus sp. M5D2P5]|uniref:cyclase family protein n=1 Tax=Acuticoccus kalidii TaxID=2910977 RepID=UPI001F25EF06|nr:cyclase family protein [Acuticoccus kalidii]MCF3932355.1 cyclase family protein [Acuticoccus kalidii]